MSQDPAIRTSIWLGGSFTQRGPSTIGYTPRRFETVTRTANLGIRVDRPYTQAVLPNVRTRAEFNFAWPTVQEGELLDRLDSLLAKGQPFEMAMWKQAYDIFDGDGSTTTFLLQRRLLLPTVTPDVVWDSYLTEVYASDAPYGTVGAAQTSYTVSYKTTAELSGTPGTNEAWIEDTGHRVNGLWVSTMKVNPAPDAVKDALVAIYLPLYEVVGEEGPRSYTQGIVEPRTIKLTEFG